MCIFSIAPKTRQHRKVSICGNTLNKKYCNKCLKCTLRPYLTGLAQLGQCPSIFSILSSYQTITYPRMFCAVYIMSDTYLCPFSASYCAAVWQLGPISWWIFIESSLHYNAYGMGKVIAVPLLILPLLVTSTQSDFQHLFFLTLSFQLFPVSKLLTTSVNCFVRFLK